MNTILQLRGYLEDPNHLFFLLTIFVIIVLVNLGLNILPRIRSIPKIISRRTRSVRFNLHDKQRQKRMIRLRSWIIKLIKLREKMADISFDDSFTSSQSIKNDIEAINEACAKIRECLNEAEENSRRSRLCLENFLRVAKDDSLEIANYVDAHDLFRRFMRID